MPTAQIAKRLTARLDGQIRDHLRERANPLDWLDTYFLTPEERRSMGISAKEFEGARARRDILVLLVKSHLIHHKCVGVALLDPSIIEAVIDWLDPPALAQAIGDESSTCNAFFDFVDTKFAEVGDAAAVSREAKWVERDRPSHEDRIEGGYSDPDTCKHKWRSDSVTHTLEGMLLSIRHCEAGCSVVQQRPEAK